MKNKASSIKANFAYQMIYEILIIILPFITSPYIARVIGAKGLGTFSYSQSVAYYFVLFSLLGIKNYGNRTIAQNREDQDRLNEIFSNLVSIHSLISLICFAIYIGYVLILKGEARIYAAIQIFYVLSGIFDISWFYFGIEKFKMTVTRNTIIKILNVFCVFLFVKNSNDLWKYCLIMSAGTLISQLILWVPLKKYVALVRPSWKKMKVHIQPLFLLFIPAIAVSLYKYMDKIMIGTLSSKTQLGFYENAEKIINIPTTVIASFGTVMLPKMSNLAVSANKNAASRYMRLSFQFVMCLAFAFACGLAGVGQVFAPVFWGEEFMLSGTLIMGLSITIPFVSFANIIRTQYLIPTAKDKEYLSSVVIGAVVNLAVNWFLIPTMGSIGAMIGTIFAESSVCLVQCFIVQKEIPIGKYFKDIIIFLPIGMIMSAIVFWIGRQMSPGILTLLIQVFIGACFYCICCLIYFYRIRNEILMKMIDDIRYKIGMN